MRFSYYEQFFSQPRMARYLAAAKGDVTLAKRMYRANMAISEAFSPLLSAFEVCLRNQINHHLTRHFGRRDWILSERSGFMSDQSLGPSFKMREEVRRAERKLHNDRRAVTGATVLAEQTMGFWVSMFEPGHYRLLRGIPIHAFKTLPPRHGRNEISNKLHAIRMFRNRVYHNEPICFNNGLYDLSKASEVLQNLIDLSTWIDPAFSKWLERVSRAARLFDKYDLVA